MREPEEFDFKTKAEILEIRKGCVARYARFAPESYQPSEEVFGRIEDGKPWWGFLGLSYYGNGQDSISGESEESRFILNPLLLVGISPTRAYRVKNSPFPPVPIYPVPLSLAIDENGHSGRVVYNLRDFLALQRQYYDNSPGQEFEFVAYNARDLGYRYMSVAYGARNVQVNRAMVHGVPLIQFIHCGGSCGYPGGCNNASPLQAEMTFTVRSLPASVSLKLWKTKPVSAEADADMVFTIEMI